MRHMGCLQRAQHTQASTMAGLDRGQGSACFAPASQTTTPQHAAAGQGEESERAARERESVCVCVRERERERKRWTGRRLLWRGTRFATRYVRTRVDREQQRRPSQRTEAELAGPSAPVSLLSSAEMHRLCAQASSRRASALASSWPSARYHTAAGTARAPPQRTCVPRCHQRHRA